MKIAQFLPYFPPHKWGIETVAEEFSTHFVNEEHGAVMNVVFSVGQESLLDYQENGYEVVIIPAFDIIPNYSFPKFWKKQFRSALKKVKTWNPDVIQTHTRFFLATFLGGICAKLWEKKRVHIEHGSGFVQWLAWWKAAISWLYDHTLGRLVLRAADALVAISWGNMPFIRRFSKAPVEVIYRGVDFPLLEKIEKKSDHIVIGFVGRLVKLKGIDVLLSAFAWLQADFPHLLLHIVGDGEERGRLESQVNALNIWDKVRFFGFQEKSKVQSDFLPSFDVFVNPSLQEGLPTTVIEALLARCVVVATDVWGTREISDQEDLILVPAGSVEALKLGIKRAIENYRSFQGRSFDEVRERFDWGKGVECYQALYAKLLK